MLSLILSGAALCLPLVVGARLSSFDYNQQSLLNAPDVKVSVQLGVMSRCPDALLCESRFAQVLDKVSDKVNLSLVYVAKIDDTEPDFGVWCMHGRQECAGNVQQLCVNKYAPFPNWWEFVKCQNFQGRENIGLPEVAFKCAETADVDLETSGAGQCIGSDGSGIGTEGVTLLQESTLLGKELGITKSCTVLISGRKVCVHDGSWKDCEGGHEVNDFVRQIEDEYERLNG
ncbi:hypothetical protein CPB84DRAFT_1757832 [Gymnopilus junonius]|uniref:Uncharacterized protein n=1 Tax=Gymnopilus junonius TaxID=109634 RepID=A0A9P5NYK8_GYMJU|nr:hypothetical protein CPB84DRAFT_1757832 [Gymnopilus junonius]